MISDVDLRIEELYKQGKPYHEIGADVGLSVASIYRHLRKAGLLDKYKHGLITVQKPECNTGKIMGFAYSLPHLFDDELETLTPNEIEERRQAELRAFEIDHRRRMTPEEAVRLFHLSYRELEQEFGITTEQAKILHAVARDWVPTRA